MSQQSAAPAPHSMTLREWSLRLRLYLACAVLGEFIASIDSLDPADWRSLAKFAAKLAFTAAVTWRAFLDRSHPADPPELTPAPMQRPHLRPATNQENDPRP